mgnify:CR=1 FL=1
MATFAAPEDLYKLNALPDDLPCLYLAGYARQLHLVCAGMGSRARFPVPKIQTRTICRDRKNQSQIKPFGKIANLRFRSLR